MGYVVTGAFVALLVWAAYRVLHLHLRGIRTTATIVNIVQDKSSDGPVENLVVQFTTDTGATVEANSFFGMQGVAAYYRVGEQVYIRYSPKNPQVFAIEGYDVAGVFFIFLVAAGACGIAYQLFGNS